MSHRDHLRIEDYAVAANRPDGTGLIARHTQEHLVSVCADCRAEWQRLGALRATYLDRLRDLAGRPSPGPFHNEIAATPVEIAIQEAFTSDRLRLYRNVLNEKSDLLRTPVGQRVRKIRRARTRFRTPLLAEMLIEECRKRVRDAPADAVDIAALVAEILGWAEDIRPVPAHAVALLARAAAHHANALRVVGDLHAAERTFVRLRCKLAERPLADIRIAAEIASLEASLCVDQRRFDVAEERLARAAMGYRAAADRIGLARTRIQQANLMGHLGRHDEVARLLDLDDLQVDLVEEPHLYLCAVTARINALCEVDRFSDAKAVLAAHTGSYEASEDLLAGVIFRSLQGRIALGMGSLECAEEALADARDGMLLLGRNYDAALMTLYLAEALLETGKLRELASLAKGLVAEFRSRGIEGEALSALKLLTQAVATQSLTASLLADLRQRLISPASSSISPAPLS